MHILFKLIFLCKSSILNKLYRNFRIKIKILKKGENYIQAVTKAWLRSALSLSHMNQLDFGSDQAELG